MHKIYITKSHLQTPHRAASTTTAAHRPRNLLMELFPVGQWFDSQELDERIQFGNIVLPIIPVSTRVKNYNGQNGHGCTSQAPSKLALKLTASNSSLSLDILDIMRFI